MLQKILMFWQLILAFNKIIFLICSAKIFFFQQNRSFRVEKD